MFSLRTFSLITETTHGFVRLSPVVGHITGGSKHFYLLTDVSADTSVSSRIVLHLLNTSN